MINLYDLNQKQYAVIRDHIWRMDPDSSISLMDIWTIKGLDLAYQHEVRAVIRGLIKEGVLIETDDDTFKRTDRRWDLVQYADGLIVTKTGDALVKERREKLREMCAVNSGEVYRFLLEALQGSITYTVKNKKSGKFTTTTAPVSVEERIKIAKYMLDKTIPDLRSVEIKNEGQPPLSIQFVIPQETPNNDNIIDISKEVKNDAC